MRNKLEQYLTQYGLILVGYSGSDASITDNLKHFIQSPEFLNNGLYWCFRENDTVSDNVLTILKSDKAFYVIIDGYDEILAELHTRLIGDSTPFNSKIATSRAEAIIQSYLENERLKQSVCKTIQRHLKELQNDQTQSQVYDALNSLQSESLLSSGLTDKHLLVQRFRES